jgi:hypothetical protein
MVIMAAIIAVELLCCSTAVSHVGTRAILVAVRCKVGIE